MKRSHTFVLERLKEFTGRFDTEPIESGWAGEAMFFIRVHEMPDADVSIESYVQVSADGINWIDEGTHFPAINGPGDYFVRVREFGGWLRLRNEVLGADPAATLTVHLALKE